MKTNDRLLHACCRLILWAVVAGCVSPAGADEGMWTLNNPPRKLLKERYNFEPTEEWLAHVRRASVRFNDGGSGSFVSPSGLVLTNHHVALGQLQKISSAEKDYVTHGFYASRPAEELKCPDLELNVLASLEDVTARVTKSVKAGMSKAEALKARNAEMAKIEKESLDATGLHSEVVTLYHGGEYWLHRYQRYTDVRLVFAPEQQIAFFGGDPDNFTFPRYNLDMAIFRVYENDRPLHSPHYLKWNAKGAAEGELVFVAGHPGSTERGRTLAQLEATRDYDYPAILKILRRRLAVLQGYSAQGSEQSRQAKTQIFNIENAIKAFTGEYDGLLDSSLMEKKRRDEKEFRAQISANAAWKREYGKAWDAIARAERKRTSRFKAIRYRSLRGARLASVALQIVRYVAEVNKPDGERLEGYHESELESLRFTLTSPAPYYPQLEEVLLANSLQESLEELGPNDPLVAAALGGRSPAEAAKAAIRGTRLTEAAYRRSLLEGGEGAVAASKDPLLALAQRIDQPLRDIQNWVDDNVDSVVVDAGEKIGQARFAAYGTSAYPDATFTLRLAYGTVRGYPMNGTQAPSKTTFYGLYDRAHGFDHKPPYDLPGRYLERRAELNLETPFNFVTTCDVVGGNSGSPVVDRSARIVGLIFDGNIESLVGNFVYLEETNRSIAVHTAAILEALRKLYGAGALADQLEAEPSGAVPAP